MHFYHQIFGVEYYGSECFYGSKGNSRTQPFKYGHAGNCELETMGAAWSFYVYVSCKDNATCESKLDFFDTIFKSKINKLDETLAVNTAQYLRAEAATGGVL